MGGTRLKKCKGCGHARYCGRDCQKADWASHQHDCVALAGWVAKPHRHIASSFCSHMSCTNPRCKRVFEVQPFNPWACPYCEGRAEMLPTFVAHQRLSEWRKDIIQNRKDGLLCDAEYTQVVMDWHAENDARRARRAQRAAQRDRIARRGPVA